MFNGLIKRRKKVAMDGNYAVLSSFNHDGVEIARRKPSVRREFPVRHLFLFLLAVASFKVFLFLDMGAGAYGSKVEQLSNGSQIEQLAGWAMALDPVSEYVVDGMRFGSW